MKNQERNRKWMEATGLIRDEYIEEAAGKTGARPVLKRLIPAAVAAVLVVGVFFLPGVPGVSVDPGTTDGGENQSHFVVRVHAAEWEAELGTEPIFSEEEIRTAPSIDGLLTDGTVYEYNEATGEWEIVMREQEEYPSILLEVLWEGFDEYRPYIALKCNGEEIDIPRMKENFLVGYIGYQEKGMVGWGINCYFEKQSTLEITVYDKDTGTTLMNQVIRITPAIYQKEVSSDGLASGEVTAIENDGYLLEVLEEFTIDLY